MNLVHRTSARRRLRAVARATRLAGFLTLIGYSRQYDETVAAAQTLPCRALAATSAVAGAGIGLGSGPESVSGGALWATLLGTCTGATVWLFNGASLVHLLHPAQAAKRLWPMILVRVAGSWVTASSVLVLALWLTGAQRQTPPGQAPMSLDVRR